MTHVTATEKEPRVIKKKKGLQRLLQNKYFHYKTTRVLYPFFSPLIVVADYEFPTVIQLRCHIQQLARRMHAHCERKVWAATWDPAA